MAQSGKRRRNATNDDDGESLRGHEDGRTSPVGDTRKRARMSLNGRSGHQTPGLEDEHSESDGSDDEGERADRGPPPQTQYEIMRDAGFEHLKHMEMDDMWATQKIKQKAARLGNNMVAESGIIESVECINFMCHSRLHVELGPLINFIVGENGSGKSAVLTALTLCLGGKASDTNRGGSLKSFIKEGEPQGSVTVKIKNAGTDAYRPDLYGETIIIERTLGKQSKFRIKTSTGRVVSDKRAEVDEICEWYALQIGNPLTVLSQDNARQFLNSATPAQKYKFFFAGVQLEQLDNDYKLCVHSLDTTLPLLHDLKVQVAEVERATKDAENKAAIARQNESLRAKRRVYRNQMVWCQVTDQERILEKLDAEIEETGQKIMNQEQTCVDAEKAFDKTGQSLEEARQSRANLETEGATQRNDLEEKQAAYDSAKKKVTDLQFSERDAYQSLQHYTKELDITKGKIKEEETRLAAAAGSERAEAERQLSEAQGKAKDLREKLQAQHGQLPELNKQLADSKEVVDQKRKDKELKRQEVQRTQSQLQQVRNQAPSEFSGFDRELADLARDLKRDQGFEQRPVGPMGAHIRLLKPNWSSIVEKTLGESLNAFIVRNKRDQTRLNNMIRQRRMRKPPPVYLAYCERIDTTSQDPSSDIDTILRILEFDSELVKAQLVINNSIEKIALMEQRQHAQRLMLDGPPRNVAACLTFHDGKRGWGLRLTNRQGSASTAPIPPWGGASRLKTDSSQQISHLQDTLRLLEADLAAANTEERQAVAAQNRCETAIRNNQASAKDLAMQLRRAEAEVESVQTEYDQYDGVDDRLNTLRSQLDEQERQENTYGTQYGHLRSLIQEAKEELAARRAERDEIVDAQNDFSNRIAKADKKVASKESLRKYMLKNKNDAFLELDVLKEQKSRANNRREEQVQTIAEFISQAEQIAPDRVYIADGETVESVQQKYKTLDDQLKQRERQQGKSDKDLFDEAVRMRALLDRKRQDAADQEQIAELLKRSIDQRLNRYKSFQRQISARVRMQFNMLLSERGFRGRIFIDIPGRKIDIHIEPDETRRSAHGRNTKTLSGGEKSFSSICMLLSIWEAIGSPIRCLDEFDVFMDNVNRAISTNMLVDAARRSVGKQFILITPNAIEGRVKLEKDVKIIRLTDPRQRTLM